MENSGRGNQKGIETNQGKKKTRKGKIEKINKQEVNKWKDKQKIIDFARENGVSEKAKKASQEERKLTKKRRH